MRCQETYQEENTSSRDGIVGDIYPEMDLLHMDQPGNPVSRDLVESIRRHEHTAQGEETYGEYEDDKDETFLEYHSQMKAICQMKTVMMTKLCISGDFCEPSTSISDSVVILNHELLLVILLYL